MKEQTNERTNEVIKTQWNTNKYWLASWAKSRLGLLLRIAWYGCHDTFANQERMKNQIRTIISLFIKQKDRSATYIYMHEIHVETL